jgi:AraC-like DNA-binding protein
MARLMETGLNGPVDGNGLARAANYSRYYFQRLFRQQTGETPASCCKRLRLERAGYQLSRSKLPVTQIAFEAGFEPLEGFSRSFRKATGLSPRQYRRSDPQGWFLSSPNPIHYDPVIGAALRLLLTDPKGGSMDLTERLTDFDYLTTRQILEAAR